MLGAIDQPHAWRPAVCAILFGLKPSTEASYRERLMRALVYLQSHLDEDPALDDLARVACFSPYHFHRIFRGFIGESVAEHVRRLRLERAAHRLKYRDDPVTGIAFDSGYESHEAFSRAFRARFGESPTEFRDSHAPAAEAAPGPLQVRVVRWPPMRVAFVRHVGDYAGVGECWQRLFAWIGRRGLFGPAMRLLGVIHDDPEITSPGLLRYDAAIAVGPDIAPEGEIGIAEWDSREYAAATHRGPYEELYRTYARICRDWLFTSGRELGALPAVEVYRNYPGVTAPADLLTDVHLPLD